MEEEKRICKICHTPNLIQFISFGQMPVANAFLKKEDLEKSEFKYEMKVGFCENCKMVQLINIVPYEKYIVPDINGKRNYPFFSSKSTRAMEEHFADAAKEIENKFLDSNSKVLEIGSNDGIFLKNFENNKVLGIEPSNNVAEIAIEKGIETITEFFSEDLARKIVWEKGKFRTIFSANVILNIIDLHDLMKGVNHLLDEDGVFVFEDPYIIDILEKNSYDQIYDEHIWYFSLTSLSNLLERHNLDIFDAERQWVHGGSMRVYVCKRGRRNKTERLMQYLREEKEKKIDTVNPYLDFSRRVEESKKELKELLINLKSQGKKIAGYAAASKGTIVMNYCDIGRETLDYIADSTPYKHGLYTPGKHIPIVSPEYFQQDKNVDYALLSAWNHAEGIMKKEKEFLERGGRFIVHYPMARILGYKTKIKPSEDNIKKLDTFANDQGYLLSIRKDDKIFGGKVGQALVSTIYPGVIKGLHLHEKQTDYTTCIKGHIKYVAIKEKEDGTKEIKTLIIGEKNPILVKTPPGVWHGYTPLANKEAVILHLMDKEYNPKNDDTQRKDPFDFGDVWSVKNN